MPSVSPQEFQLGAWHVVPDQNRIADQNEAVQLEPRVMALLVDLAKHAGQVRTRENLLADVWEDLVVGEEALTRAVFELRKALGDDAQAPQYIETIRKGGYRLIAPVQDWPSGDGAAPAAWLSATKQHDIGWAWLALGGLAVFGLAGWWWTAETPALPQAVPLTAWVGQEIDPALSPDGQQVAFSWRDATAGSSYDLFVKTIGSEHHEQRTSHPADEVGATWSPDGTRLAFVQTDDTACTIQTMPSTGGAAQPLTTCAPSTTPALSWSPDGKTLAFSDRAAVGQPFRVFQVDLASGTRTPITTPPATFFGDAHPVFAPPDAPVWLAFVRTNAYGISDVFTLEAPGQPAVQATFDELKVLSLAWSATGEVLYFVSNRTGQFRVWSMPTRGGTPLLVPGLEGQAVRTLSHQQNRLVYARAESDHNIWAYPLAVSEEAARRIASTRWDAHAVFSPDGTQIAFTSDRGGTPEVWVARADGTQPLQLTTFGGPFQATPAWSPDGTSLVFTSRTAGNADLYVIAATGGLPRRLTTNEAIEFAPSWSPDGQWIYFTSNREARWQLWRIPANGGAVEQVFDDSIYTARLAPDGATWHFTKPGQNGLWQRSPDGTVQLLIPTVSPRSMPTWQATAKGLYYLGEEANGQLALFFFDTATQQHTPHLLLPANVSGTFSLSLDETTVLFTRLDAQTSDLMLVDGWP